MAGIYLPQGNTRGDREKKLLGSLQPPGRRGSNRKELFVANLHGPAMQNKLFLLKLFSHITTVKSIRHYSEKTFAFVEIDENASLGHAVHLARKSPIFKHLGLRVAVPRSREECYSLKEMQEKVAKLRELDKENGFEWEQEEKEEERAETISIPEDNKELVDEPVIPPVEEAQPEVKIVRGTLVIEGEDEDEDQRCCFCTADAVVMCSKCRAYSCFGCYTKDAHSGRCVEASKKKVRDDPAS